jgi:hypothetical protein
LIPVVATTVSFYFISLASSPDVTCLIISWFGFTALLLTPGSPSSKESFHIQILFLLWLQSMFCGQYKKLMQHHVQLKDVTIVWQLAQAEEHALSDHGHTVIYGTVCSSSSTGTSNSSCS